MVVLPSVCHVIDDVGRLCSPNHNNTTITIPIGARICEVCHLFGATDVIRVNIMHDGVMQ
jgi:hypothetical protein